MDFLVSKYESMSDQEIYGNLDPVFFVFLRDKCADKTNLLSKHYYFNISLSAKQ